MTGSTITSFTQRRPSSTSSDIRRRSSCDHRMVRVIAAVLLLSITTLTLTQGKNRQILSPRPSVAMRSLTKQNKQNVRGANLRAVHQHPEEEHQRDLTVLIDLSNLKKDKSMEEEPPAAAQANKEKEVLLEEEVDLLKQEVNALEDELVAMESLGNGNKKEKTDKDEEEDDEIVNDEDEQEEQDGSVSEEETTTDVLALDGTQHDSTTSVTNGVVKYCGLQKLYGTIECSVHPKLIRCESYVDCEPLEQDGDFFYRECLEECNLSDINPTHAEQALKDLEQRKQILASKEQDEDNVELQNDEATLEAALKELANQEHSEEHVFDEQVDNALLSQGAGVDVGVTFEVKYCGTRDSVGSGGDFECDSQAVLCRSDADCENITDANPKYNKCLASCKGIVDQQASNLSVIASDGSASSSSSEEDENEDGNKGEGKGQGQENGKGQGQENNGQGQAQGQSELKKTTEKTKEQLEVMAQDLTSSTTNEKLQKDDPLYEHTQKASDSSTGYCGLQVIEGATPECDNQVIQCDTDNDCSLSGIYTKCLSECKMILFEGLTYDEHQQLMEETATGGGLVIPTDPLVEYFEPGSEINQQVQQGAASEGGASSNTYVFNTVRKYCGIQGDTPTEFHCQTGPFKPCQTNDDCRSTSTRRTKRGRRKGLRFLQQEEGSDANESISTEVDTTDESESDETAFELLPEEETNIYTDCLIECGEVAAMEDPTSALLDIPTVMVDVTTQEGYNG